MKYFTKNRTTTDRVSVNARELSMTFGDRTTSPYNNRPSREIVVFFFNTQHMLLLRTVPSKNVEGKRHETIGSAGSEDSE